MKIFYAGLQYNYYNPKRGQSFEHNNFYLSLKKFPGADVSYFPFERILEVGKESFNKELLAAVKKEKPDLLFVFTFSDEFEKNTLEEIKKHTTSIAWFADDSWRFHNYSRFWARHFSWAVTTYSWMPELYRKIGQPNVIRSQWAADISLYKPAPLKSFKEAPDASFVGTWSKPREKVMRELEKNGVGVKTYGGGWPGGRVSDDEMLELFSQSKINLGLNPAPGYFNKNSLGRLLFRRSINNKIVPDLHFYSNLRGWFDRGIPQIKARHFEIPACGGFLMTSMADDLGSYYKLGDEIVVYENTQDLIKKIRYYLAHEEERKKIARAGYERTIKDHTYEKRFGEIFRNAGILK